MNILIKPAKKVLSDKYGARNVSVRNGRGTASGWVEVSITTKRPEPACGREHNVYELCYTCSDALRAVSNEAEKIMYAAWDKEGVKPYTYATDYSDKDSSCVMISVNYI